MEGLGGLPAIYELGGCGALKEETAHRQVGTELEQETGIRVWTVNRGIYRLYLKAVPAAMIPVASPIAMENTRV